MFASFCVVHPPVGKINLKLVLSVVYSKDLKESCSVEPSVLLWSETKNTCHEFTTNHMKETFEPVM